MHTIIQSSVILYNDCTTQGVLTVQRGEPLKCWCPGPESNRHALRRGILSRPAPLQVNKYGTKSSRKFLYNVLYNEEILLVQFMMALRVNLFHQSSKRARGIRFGQLGWFGGLDGR